MHGPLGHRTPTAYHVVAGCPSTSPNPGKRRRNPAVRRAWLATCRRRDGKVVDQARIAQTGGREQAGGIRADSIDGLQAFAVAQLHIVDRGEADLEQACARRRQKRCRRSAIGQRCGGVPQDTVQLGRDASLLGREVGVAGGHGEPVRLPDRRSPDDFHRHVQIIHHATNHQQLLVVLLAENGEIRLHPVEQLGDHRGHTAEEMRPGLGAEPAGRPLDHHPGGVVGRVHGTDIRQVDEIDAELLEPRQISRLVPRVAFEILARSELGRIDENRHHQAPGDLPPVAHQRQMPLVQGTHGRHQGDLRPAATPAADDPAQCRRLPHDLHGSDPVRHSPRHRLRGRRRSPPSPARAPVHCRRRHRAPPAAVARCPTPDPGCPRRSRA